MKYPLDYLRLHSGKGRKMILTDYVEEDDDEDLFFTPSLADDSDHEDTHFPESHRERVSAAASTIGGKDADIEL